MAKSTTPVKKKVSTSAKKSSPAKKASNSSITLDMVNEAALTALKKLNIEEKLQNDIAWCLGSYRHDNNPVGLIETAKRAITVLKAAKAKNAKAVAVKVITDLEKVVK
ncbi:hypothetical protein SanaruYs_07640 [Chryseotalea sanaruensis]|uniref:Uncharacterized protein n=1 Tax=Chryseotalea sanaruensis TaxID=2482724 RepID=A0A401U6P9_9BACT|nr:hypothetical protein [Chryseotalea sanaruensis]GCC50549.1 hypothetical protein SanaruYs_07640 [Chryseotalea sanaruensis]